MRLFDATFLLDLVNDDEGAAELADRVDREVSFKAISVVTVYEYLLGVRSLCFSSKQLAEKLASANRDLSPFQVLPLIPEVARESSELQASLQRNGRMLGTNDLYISSTALWLKLTVVTRNVEDFKRVPYLRIETH